ncbi:MAG TPA: hypothetical protein VFF76_04995 [Holophagaceae bacterium]|nr:hypothetical protein [Holophagaceae bacterium]
MSMDALNALPDDARLWLLVLDPAPDAEALAQLTETMDALVSEWRHKGVQYAGAWTLLEGRILALAEPTMTTAPSGCAIDGMMRKVGRLTAGLNLSMVDPATTVLVRLHDGLRAIPKADLEARLGDGTLDAATPVLDPSLFVLGDLKAGKLEKPLARTWIARKHKVATGV